MGGQRGFFWFCCWFYFFALHVGSSTLVRRSNMAFAKLCLMKTRKSTIVSGIQHPGIFQSRNKTKINMIYALNWVSHAFQKTFLDI